MDRLGSSSQLQAAPDLTSTNVHQLGREEIAARLQRLSMAEDAGHQPKPMAACSSHALSSSASLSSTGSFSSTGSHSRSGSFSSSGSVIRATPMPAPLWTHSMERAAAAAVTQPSTPQQTAAVLAPVSPLHASAAVPAMLAPRAMTQPPAQQPAAANLTHQAAELAALEQRVMQKQAMLHALDACITQMVADLTRGEVCSEESYSLEGFVGGGASPRAAHPAHGHSVSDAVQASKLRKGVSSGNLAGKARVQQQRNEQLAAENERTSKSVDVLIMMDCTGSMGKYIEAMKAKCLEIYNQAPLLHPGFIIRLAFVGYRDYGEPAGVEQYIVHDFVGHEEAGSLKGMVNKVQASGGGDDVEDVAGALQKATHLDWRSSTRLLVHFGDAPCHGSKYHEERYSDHHPGGDPFGLVPEELLHTLISRRVDYYFARIGPATDQMVEVFKSVYEDSRSGVAFTVMDCKEPAADFIPLILNSVSGSMSRNGGRAQHKGPSRKLLNQLPDGLYVY